MSVQPVLRPSTAAPGVPSPRPRSDRPSPARPARTGGAPPAPTDRGSVHLSRTTVGPVTAVLTLFPAEALPPGRDREQIEAELQVFVQQLLRRPAVGTAAAPPGDRRLAVVAPPRTAERDRSAGGLPQVDPLRPELTIDGVTVRLSGREHALLRHLDDNRGRVIPRSDLLLAVWGWTSPTVTRTVDVHVARLRRKLGRHADALRTIVGAGYVYG